MKGGGDGLEGRDSRFWGMVWWGFWVWIEREGNGFGKGENTEEGFEGGWVTVLVEGCDGVHSFGGGRGMGRFGGVVEDGMVGVWVLVLVKGLGEREDGMVWFWGRWGTV
ncbi:uncharacterized protein G2W53_015589 [Senna tora]|uniref:Uncharacterized protein n=1 Tax=Senna tora TaxID=362788 RepID=A0A834WVI3_9FABA|nr:uncharacterized protein G2W53_015589 [Senna tora]